MTLSRRVFPLLLIVGVALLCGQGASAHALVVESAPALDAILGGAPLDVTLRFNSRIDHERSRLTLIGPGNSSRPLTVLRTSAPDILQASAGRLPPGSYKLRWQVLAIDGHITRGDIPFSVTQP